MIKLTIEEMHKVAKKRGGTCLSKKYEHSKKKLKWKCKKGHIWEAVPVSVKGGTWCPICFGNPLLSIDEMQKLAKKRKGECVSKRYNNCKTKLKWRCKEGHTWMATPNSVRSGIWCPECGHKAAGIKQRATIEEMQKLAKKKGGECVSKKYVTTSTKLKWKCKEGHKWETTPSSIKSGTWCPTCRKIKSAKKNAKKKVAKKLTKRVTKKTAKKVTKKVTKVKKAKTTKKNIKKS